MTILVDTSILRDVQSFQRLAAAAKDNDHRILIPTFVRQERDFQMRRHLASTTPPRPYSGDVVRDFYARFEGVVDFLSLTVDEADRAAERLAGRFPSDEMWKAAKQDAARACVGEPAKPPGKHRSCGGQVDWYLAALASPERPMVTRERVGAPEWSGWRPGSVLNLTTALQILGQPA